VALKKVQQLVAGEHRGASGRGWRDKGRRRAAAAAPCCIRRPHRPLLLLLLLFLLLNSLLPLTFPLLVHARFPSLLLLLLLLLQRRPRGARPPRRRQHGDWRIRGGGAACARACARGAPALLRAVQLLQLCQLRCGRKKDKLHALPVKVAHPRRALRGRQKVRLVEHQQAALVGVYLPHVRLQVGAAVQQRVPRVHDLHQNVAALHHAPQLPPHVNVFFKGRHRAGLRALGRAREPAAVRQLRHRHVAPPRKERVFLRAVQLLGAGAVLPPRAPRDGQVAHRARGHVAQLRRGQRPKRTAPGEAGQRRGGRLRHKRHLPTLRGKCAVRHACNRHKLLQGGRLRHALQRVGRRAQVRNVEARAARHVALRATVLTQTTHRGLAKLAAALAAALLGHGALCFPGGW